jgi:hypothetical protein
MVFRSNRKGNMDLCLARAVPIRLDADRKAVEAGTPVPLFAARVGRPVGGGRQEYMVSPNGQRFLINTLTDEAATPLTLILNWNQVIDD